MDKLHNGYFAQDKKGVLKDSARATPRPTTKSTT